LFGDKLFQDFGPSDYVLADGIVRTTRIDGSLRGQVRTQAPSRPGVYGMLDRDEQLLYVGKAKNLRVRLLSYFRRKGRPPKAGRLVGQARSIIWEVLPSEFASLLRELELIRRWRPRWNVQGQPLRRRLAFVCMGRAPAPYLYLTRNVTARVQAAFGPVTAGDVAIRAIRCLNDCYKLRDCPEPQEMIFPDQGDLFPGVRPAGCLRMDIGTCLGPCTGACTRRDYQKQTRQARAFLTGEDKSVLDILERDMAAAAMAQQFERAADLRDRLDAVRWLSDRLQRVRRAQREMSFVYPVAGHDGSTTWYLIHGARVVAALSPPNDQTRESVREKLNAVYRAGLGLLDSYEHADSMMVVMQWFRKYPDQRRACISPDAAATL
jgi:excinuclease ABC subunit C